MIGMRLRTRFNRSVKTVLGRVVFGLGLGRLVLSGRAVVVAFHRVRDGGTADAMAMPVAEFRQWCRFFARHFRVVGPAAIVDKLERGEPLCGELAITFDDGYRDFRTLAVPVLGSLGLTAAVFAVSDFVGADVTPWWDAAETSRHPFLDWDELRQVAGQGFTVGSHGKTHAGMDELSPEAARDELALSKAALEAGLGREVALYAYPYGDPERMPDPARDLVRATGYRACFGYGGLVEAGTSPFHIGRICVNDWLASPAQFGGHLLVLRLRRLLAR
jgi:peptidoglycan/xylan/chitin deacetylase (PgdA/CDA1 family)